MSLKSHKAAFLGLLLLMAVCSACAVVKPAVLTEIVHDFAPCLEVFPSGAFEVVHRIDADLAGGHKAGLIGVTKTNGQDRTCRSVLLTAEGMVLLDASSSDRGIEVHRAMPPFDSRELAAGLLNDVTMILFAPAGTPLESGRLPDGRRACRWQRPDGGLTELALAESGQWSLSRRDRWGRIIRTVQARGPESRGFYQEMELEAPGAAGYRLKLHLLSVEVNP